MKQPHSTHRNFSWRKLGMNLLATLSLGLALGSALASSVAAREGNWVGAVVLAVFSLLLALTISLTVVPHLLNRARGEWLKFSINTTREGWLYLLILSVTGVAAFNSGNNLLFVVFSVELAILIVSEVLSRLNLYGLQIRIDLPEVVAAHQKFNVGITLKNEKWNLPSFSVQLNGGSIRLAERRFGTEKDSPHENSQSIQCYLPFLPGATGKKYNLPLRISRRGRHVLRNMKVSSRFPLGFVEKVRRSGFCQDVLVLPELDLPEEFFENLPLLSGALGSYFRGRGVDLHSLREYSIRDSARFIDWRASAKTESLMFREFTREDDRRCCFVFDNYFPGFEETWRPAFERAIVLCANAARHFHEMACEIRLVTPEGNTPFSKTRMGLVEILKILALIEPSSEKSQSIVTLAGDQAFKIIFSASHRGEIPTAVWISSHVVFTRELQPRN